MKDHLETTVYGQGSAGQAAALSRGFTLIELLVVVSIIGLLVGLIVPALSSAMRSSKAMACKAMLRGYQIASTSYSLEHGGRLLDSYRHLDPVQGIPQYWTGSGTLPESITRCPDDYSTEGMGRLGVFSQYNDLKVSIGCNENTMSASARQTSQGKKNFRVNRSDLGGSPSRMMTWSDWQNNPYVANPSQAIVKPVDGGMGSLCFRHNGSANAAYLDEHVGDMTPTINLSNNGHDWGAGASWGISGSVAQMFKTYYPFGPAMGFEKSCKGDWPTIKFK